VRIPPERPLSGDRSSYLAVNQASQNKEVSGRVVQSHRAPPSFVVADGARSAEMAQPRAERVGESCGYPQRGRHRHGEQQQLQRAVNALPTGLRRCKSLRLDHDSHSSRAANLIEIAGSGCSGETIASVLPTAPTLMSPRTIVFDSNAYRVATHEMPVERARDWASRLRMREREIGNRALAHPIVAWELLAHLRDPADPAYADCLGSVMALGTHAASREVPGTLDLVAEAYLTVWQALFGRVSTAFEAAVKNLAAIVCHIVSHAPDLSDRVLHDNLEHLARAMMKNEQAWLNGMTQNLNQFGPATAKVLFGEQRDQAALSQLSAFFGSSTFQEVWAKFVVAWHAVELGILDLPPDQLRTKARDARTLFPGPFQLMSVLLRKLATPRPPNLASKNRRRWNFVWDYQISFLIGEGTIDNLPVCLVTNDGEITAAASAAGHPDSVLSLEDYLTEIGPL